MFVRFGLKIQTGNKFSAMKYTFPGRSASRETR
jgi:hypothetical protein